MNKKEAIAQLESLISDCKEFESVNPTEKDVQALELGIAALKETAQEVPVQEQVKQITILIDNEVIAKKIIRNL